jgi:hypothetical protein
MSIKYYSYKVEFAMRGAGHIHGVMWVDWETFTALSEEVRRNIKSALDNIKDDVP